MIPTDDPDVGAVNQLLQLDAMTLGTVGADGSPHTAPIYFAVLNPRLQLVYFSDVSSRHAQDTWRSGQAAAAIYPQASDYLTIHGLQLRGLVQPVESGPNWDAAWEAYRTKFPFVAELRKMVERNSLYLLTPGWVRLIDNRRGFGYKREWTLE
jgi:uncharacterized protein YhbP (UPF0306 family)